MSTSPFINDLDDYTRDLNLQRGSVEQIAKYISLRLDIPMAKAVPFVIKHISGKGNPDFAFKDPVTHRLVKVRPGLRQEDQIGFLEYVREIVDEDRICSPVMVKYENPKVERSTTSKWLEKKISGRRKSKSMMMVHKQAGRIAESILADYDQNAKKIGINSVSGMYGSPANPLFMVTGHPSLTSLCRAAAGYGNATVERFLTGSKHYHSPEVTKANLVAILTIEKQDRFTEVIEEYGLIYPSLEQTYDMIKHSTSLYWDDEEEMENIRLTIAGMTKLERAIVCYSGDFYHTAIYNPDVMRLVLGDLIALNLPEGPIDADAEIKGMSPNDKAFIFGLCASIMAGTQIDEVRENNPAGYETVARTALAVKLALNKHAKLINAFFTPKHLPPTIATLKSVQRRVGLTADTDSSIFTTQFWVKWYTGTYNRTPVADRIWYLATYMTCQCIAHSLAMLSTNIGVEREHRFRLAMKNEYGFHPFVLTNIAKHYYSYIHIREGNVYAEPVVETKGAELRGSTGAKAVLKGSADLMREIMDAADRGTKLKAYDILHKVAQFELDCIRSIRAGEYTHLRSSNIKPDTAKMAYFHLWQDVFAPKYGDSVAPPIPTVTISTELTNKTLLKEWLAKIEDRELAGRMEQWLVKYRRQDLPTIQVPREAIKGKGLPIEIQDAANVRKLAFNVNAAFYRILESTGLFLVDRNNHRLIIDFLGIEP